MSTTCRAATSCHKTGKGAVVIGASAGAIEALSQLLPQLPAEFPLPVMIVVHIPPDRNSLLTELFRPKCRMRVQEVEDKEELQERTIYFAPPDYHVLVESDGRLSLDADEPVLYSRPSIDVLFESAARVYRQALTGVILTGANSDGAAGLRAVIDAGGRGLIQNPESAQSSEMVLAAIKNCPTAEILSLDDIVRVLIEVSRTL